MYNDVITRRRGLGGCVCEEKSRRGQLIIIHGVSAQSVYSRLRKLVSCHRLGEEDEEDEDDEEEDDEDDEEEDDPLLQPVGMLHLPHSAWCSACVWAGLVWWWGSGWRWWEVLLQEVAVSSSSALLSGTPLNSGPGLKFRSFTSPS